MIVIPMAGLSSRFTKAGYKVPKFMLEAHGKTLFEHSVGSFSRYFKNERFVFITRDCSNTSDFVRQMCKRMKIAQFDVVQLASETRGQAETVFLGLKNCDYDNPITIFNIDTFRPDFEYPGNGKEASNYLEVFTGEGENWSFVEPVESNSNAVRRTAEKEPISNLCSTGLYNFESIKAFNFAFNTYADKPTSEWKNGELYIAPLYNVLIENKIEVFYHKIDRKDVVFCGTPKEYDLFLAEEKLC